MKTNIYHSVRGSESKPLGNRGMAIVTLLFFNWKIHYFGFETLDVIGDSARSRLKDDANVMLGRQLASSDV